LVSGTLGQYLVVAFIIDGATYNKQYETTEQVEFPVAYGYRVRVTLGWNDTWTVQRVIVKNTKKGISQQSKAPLRMSTLNMSARSLTKASCFRSNYDFGKVVA
jgi:hypothetical protein